MHRTMGNRLATFVLLLLCVSCSSEKVTGITESLEVHPTDLDFGSIEAHVREARTVQIQNTGARAILIEASSADGFTVEPSVLRVEAHASLEILVFFEPLDTGKRRERLSFRSLGSDAVAFLDVQGEGIPSAIQLPEHVDFGEVAIDASASLPLEVTNLTGQPLSPEVRLLAGSSFSVAADRALLPPGGTLAHTVTFQPTEAGAAWGMLEVWPCGGCARRVVLLSGEGVRRRISVDPAWVDFGHVPPGKESTQTVRVINRGETPLSLGRPSLLSEAFLLEGGAWETPLEAGEELRFDVRFVPSGVEAYALDLPLRTVEGMLLAELSVVGWGGEPRIVASPLQLDFGTTLQHRSERRLLVLENQGDPAPVALVGTAIRGEDAASFSLRGPPSPARIEVDPTELEVWYHADVPGQHAAELVLFLDHAPREIAIPIGGSTVAPEECELEADRAQIRFGLVPADHRASRQVTLRNQGAAPCWIWSVDIEGADASPFVLRPQAGLVELQPDETLTLFVDAHFTETIGGVGSASLLVRYGPVDDPQVIDLPFRFMVYPAFYDLDVGDWSLAFEGTPIDRASVRSTTIHGPHRFERLSFSAGSSRAFRIPASQGLVSCHDCPLSVGFLPEEEGAHQGELEVWLPGFELPILIELEGHGVGPCGDCADWPGPHCGEPETVRPLGEVTFSDTWPGTCNWTIVEPGTPTGSSVIDTNRYRLEKATPHACSGTVRFIQVGTYELENLRVRQDGRGAYCSSLVEVEPPLGLYIEATPLQPLEEYELALMRGGDPASRGDWWSDTSTCWAPRVDRPAICAWGAPGSQDDAVFSWEDFSPSRGPSIVRLEIPAPEVGVPYHFGYFAEPFGLVGQPYGSLRLRIYCGGAPASELQRGIYQGENRFVVHGTTIFSDPESCTFVPDGVTSFPFRGGP